MLRGTLKNPLFNFTRQVGQNFGFFCLMLVRKPNFLLTKTKNQYLGFTNILTHNLLPEFIFFKIQNRAFATIATNEPMTTNVYSLLLHTNTKQNKILLEKIICIAKYFIYFECVTLVNL